MRHFFLLQKAVKRLCVVVLVFGICCTSVYAQVRTITGKVTTNEDGSGMPGVNVVIKGTQKGTSTNATGNYSIEVNGSNPVLVFSFVGYEANEVSVGSRSVVDVSLTPGAENLNEVVVTALGIKREKRSLGYSVGEVSGKDIVNVPQENVLNALSGRVAGVTINQTSGAGSSVSVIIRGATSLSNDNQPLFVIDGVPVANSLNNIRSMGDRNNVDYGNAISDINPDDVESISVLKGPSAAALYGSRAGNGVILITTKSGKKGKGLGVSFSTSNVFETPYRYLDLHYKYGNGDRNARLDETSAYWGGPELDKGI
ncbi:MAG: TonB-dependent receptor plug domain-containing protein, partial [Runella zeae]